MVYAGMGVWDFAVYTVPMHLFYADTDLSGTAFLSRNCNAVWNTVDMDIIDSSSGDFSLEKRSEETGSAGRLGR